jgi:hypothetical protein
MKLTAMFLGTAAACLSFLALSERMAGGADHAEYHRVMGERGAYRIENEYLRARVNDLQQELARDRQRRAAVSNPVLPPAPAGDDLSPAGRIPAQSLPTTPKE